MWAAGVALFVMLTGVFPFKAADEKALYKKIQKGTYPIPKHSLTSEKVSPNARDLIAQLLHKDPLSRITAIDALKHPFIIKS